MTVLAWEYFNAQLSPSSSESPREFVTVIGVQLNPDGSPPGGTVLVVVVVVNSRLLVTVVVSVVTCGQGFRHFQVPAA